MRALKPLRKQEIKNKIYQKLKKALDKDLLASPTSSIISGVIVAHVADCFPISFSKLKILST